MAILEGVDELGLDELDRRYLLIVITHYRGGPVGIRSISAALNEEPDTLMDTVEPYLLRVGFLQITSQGRRLHPRAWEHLGETPEQEPQSRLL